MPPITRTLQLTHADLWRLCDALRNSTNNDHTQQDIEARALLLQRLDEQFGLICDAYETQGRWRRQTSLPGEPVQIAADHAQRPATGAQLPTF